MAAQAAENFSNQAASTREPSMEEILASIRRIIEDSDGKPDQQPYDTAANSAGLPHQPANSQPEKRPEANVLQTSQPVAAPVRAAAPQPAVKSESQATPSSKVEQPLRAPAAAMPVETAKSTIISDIAGRQVAAAFGELTDAFAATRRRSFDEIVEDMMRPMLQEWLDDNLPTLVERLVREEIERIARVGSR